MYSPEILQMERDLSEALGTRVAIEPKENGGKLSIDYMSEDDLRALLGQLATKMSELHVAPAAAQPGPVTQQSESITPSEGGLASDGEPTSAELSADKSAYPEEGGNAAAALDDRSAEEKLKDENEFDPGSFSL
jgi:hypothetical protein